MVPLYIYIYSPRFFPQDASMKSQAAEEQWLATHEYQPDEETSEVESEIMVLWRIVYRNLLVLICG